VPCKVKHSKYLGDRKEAPQLQQAYMLAACQHPMAPHPMAPQTPTHTLRPGSLFITGAVRHGHGTHLAATAAAAGARVEGP